MNAVWSRAGIRFSCIKRSENQRGKALFHLIIFLYAQIIRLALSTTRITKCNEKHTLTLLSSQQGGINADYNTPRTSLSVAYWNITLLGSFGIMHSRIN